MNVDGYVSSGGLGGPAILPLSMAKMAQLTQAFPDKAFSGIGGIAEFAHALNYFLLGCGTVQVCTAAMLDHAIGPNVIAGLLARHGRVPRASRRPRLDVARGLPRPAARPRRDALADPPARRRRSITAGTTPKATPRPTAERPPHGLTLRRARLRRAADDLSASPLWNPDLAPTPLDAAHLVHLPHRRALDRHERGHHHLHARLRPDAAGHDVVAGDDHHPARQHRSCWCR